MQWNCAVLWISVNIYRKVWKWNQNLNAIFFLGGDRGNKMFTSARSKDNSALPYPQSKSFESVVLMQIPWMLPRSIWLCSSACMPPRSAADTSHELRLDYGLCVWVKHDWGSLPLLDTLIPTALDPHADVTTVNSVFSKKKKTGRNKVWRIREK